MTYENSLWLALGWICGAGVCGIFWTLDTWIANVKIAYAADHEEALRVRGRAFYVVSAPVYAAMRVAWLKLSAAAQALKREDAEGVRAIANYADRMVRKDRDRFTSNQPGPGDQTTWGSPLKPGA